MNTYKLDSATQASSAQRIKDMRTMLDEIPETLEALMSALAEHNSTISTARLDEYHATLRQMTKTAIELTRNINTKTVKMIATSDQINKYLVALDEHIDTNLTDAPGTGAVNNLQRRMATKV